MQEANAKSFIKGIQDEAERLTLKRIAEDKAENERLDAEREAQDGPANASDKKKA